MTSVVGMKYDRVRNGTKMRNSPFLLPGTTESSRLL